jgi:uncharacterized protein YllA (UPF0747 family)
MEKIKLIWDFRGPVGAQTAAHFKIHVLEFFATEKLLLLDSGVESVNEMHHLAYAVIDKQNLEVIKAALKPNRGQLVKTGSTLLFIRF